MAVTQERFNEGLTYQQYVDQMTQNKDRLVENEGKVQLKPDDVAAFKNLPEKLNVLVIAEDWCGDVIAGLPVLGKLADEADTLNVRVFLRDQNEDLMNQYLKEGKFKSIPVVVFFDQQMRELGHFIERPAAQTAEAAAARNAFFAAHPEYNAPQNTDFGDLSPEARQAWGVENTKLRTERAAAWNQLLVDEMKKIVSGVPA
ncbi:MAG: thioredoxin family protein [Chloroflexota bacterium]|nr:thioredoxin family protein [Chloroflexota bacterium]